MFSAKQGSCFHREQAEVISVYFQSQLRDPRVGNPHLRKILWRRQVPLAHLAKTNDQPLDKDTVRRHKNLNVFIPISPLTRRSLKQFLRSQILRSPLLKL